MRQFHVSAQGLTELEAWPQALPAEGFLWLGLERGEFETGITDLQQALQRWCGGQLVDLHVSDLLNKQLTSHFDSTSWYDLMVFRRLNAVLDSDSAVVQAGKATAAAPLKAMAALETSAVGFAVFDRVLVSVHSADCALREFMAQRLSATTHSNDARGSSRPPSIPADLMLRMVSHIVDGYLDLRRKLTRHLGQLQQQLLDPRSRFKNWQMLLDARTALHQLDDICEDQHGAVREWTETLADWPDGGDAQLKREHELLRVRSRDVIEHVERVLTHVRRLEHSAETAVQMHFSAQSNRTNDIMRTLTVLTAIFMPLNLITGFFGMNFEFLPLIHTRTGLWAAIAVMLTVGVVLVTFFWRKRYLGSRRE